MKKNIIITTLSILLVVAVGYIAYDKVYLQKETDKTTPIVENTEDNTITENNEEEESNLLDLSQLSSYKNYDGTYGTLKSFYGNNSNNSYSYEIKLSLDGKVAIYKENKWNDINNLENVVDMIEFSYPGSEPSGRIFYFLLDNGDVYSYQIFEADKNIYSATKIETVSNVKRLIEYSNIPTEDDAIGKNGVIAINKNNAYIKITES